MAFLFDIKRFSINDGPGVRVTVFFKGCPLSCKWCHNPESRTSHPEKLYNKNKCIGAQNCVRKCPNHALTLTREGIVTDFNLCRNCGICATVCPAKAIEISGTDVPEEEIMKAIIKETNLMDTSEGGVTFSGGEPLMQYKALISLLKKCGEENIHRAVDTSGLAKNEVLQAVALHTDLFLYDVKHMDSAIHKQWTGVPNELILSNLSWIAENKIPYHVRIPLVEGVNTDDENIRNTAVFLADLPTQPQVVGLLPYHNIASKKYEKLGKQYDEQGMNAPSKERVQEIGDLFMKYGLKTLVGG